MLALVLTIGVVGDVQAQKKGNSKGKSKKSAKTEKVTVALPYNSNDCLFAIPLDMDVTYGPTTAPSGAGRLMEITRDAKHPMLFEREHNTVWYKFNVPYNGYLDIEIVQEKPSDDYDFLIYKYTDAYFSNQMIQNKIAPVAACLSQVDSNLVKAAAKKKTTGAAAAAPAAPKAKTSKAKKANVFHLGMKQYGSTAFMPRDSTNGVLKSIYVRSGETYYIVLDNQSNNGGGHSIKVSLKVDYFDPIVSFVDPNTKKSVDVDLLILEKGKTSREVAKNPTFKTGRIRFSPNFNYVLYAKRANYFTIYREFNSNMFLRDTLFTLPIHKASKGSTFTVYDIDFNEDGTALAEGSDSILNEYVMLFKNHPDVHFMIKGQVATYGEVTLEDDQRISLNRAQTVRDFFIANGIEAKRITVTGMTPAEIKRAGDAALTANGSLNKIKAQFVVTSVN